MLRPGSGRGLSRPAERVGEPLQESKTMQFPIPQRHPVTAPEPPVPPSPWFTPPPEPDRTNPKRSFFRRRLTPLLAAIVALLAKFKTVLLLLPKLKLFTTAGTMLVSITAYSF